jgi:hypothetical protein
MARKRKPLPKEVSIYKQWKSMSWCLDNNIKIYYVPKKYNEKDYFIEIDDNDNKTRSPKRYPVKEASLKISELYCYYYDKNNSN